MELHLHLGQMVGGTGDGREGTWGTPGTAGGPLDTQEFALSSPQ